MSRPWPNPKLVNDKTSNVPHRYVAFAGRLGVWDEDAPESHVALKPVQLRVIQSVFGQSEYGGDGKIGFYLRSAHGDFLIPPEWVGKSLYMELAPSAVDMLRDDLRVAARKWSKEIA